MRFEEAVAGLDLRQPEHMPRPDLDRIRALSSLLNDPQLTYPTIHVTGTNGKTTTARLSARLACEHGIATGVFTSPHLLSVTERLVVCGEQIDTVEFGHEFERLVPYLRIVDESVGSVTYFEALTALAYLWFADKPVGLAVFEVGMGGTWDATNLVTGDVAVVCPIGLDHPELGETVAEVAREKAGIIKQGKVAVVREQGPDVLQQIERRCEEQIATLLLEDRDWAIQERVPALGGQVFTVRGLYRTYADLHLALFGAHAARNAAAAVVALEALLERALDEEAVERAFTGASSPGRLEIVARRPLIVLDGAHNPAAAEALATALPEVFAWERLHLVMAVFSSKDLDGIVTALAPIADAAYAATTDSVRARPANEVAISLTAKGVATQAFPDVGAALASAREAAGERDLIVVTGSLYTVADARRELMEERG